MILAHDTEWKSFLWMNSFSYWNKDQWSKLTKDSGWIVSDRRKIVFNEFDEICFREWIFGNVITFISMSMTCMTLVCFISIWKNEFDIDCVSGKNVMECMSKIHQDIADIIRVDAADAYRAQRYYQLVPIGARADLTTNLWNLRGRTIYSTNYLLDFLNQFR